MGINTIAKSERTERINHDERIPEEELHYEG